MSQLLLANSGGAGPSHKRLCLLTLPLEIRFMIYELCLSDVGLIQPFKERLQPLQGEYIPFSARERFSRQTLGLSPNLLATCRQINEEATRILYGRHFSVVTGFEIGAGLGDFGLKFLDHIGSQNCQFIRSLHTNECFSRIHDSSQRPIKNEIHLPWQGILFFKKVIPSLKNLRVLGTFVLGRRSERMKTQHLPGEAVIAKALACHPFLSRMEEYQPPAGCGRLYAILANGEVLEKIAPYTNLRRVRTVVPGTEVFTGLDSELSPAKLA